MTQPPTRLRIRFTKENELRWISHRDLARVWERLLRRAEIQLAFSQGFHPKPKISFPSALALGIEALDEVVELDVVGDFDLKDLQTRIAAQMPPGMKLLSIDRTHSKARYIASTFSIELPAKVLEDCQVRIAELLQAESFSVERDGKQVKCDIRQAFFSLRLVDNKLFFTLPIASQGSSLRPAELLQSLNLGDILASGALLQRVQVHLVEDCKTVSTPQNKEDYDCCEHDSSLLLSEPEQNIELNN